MVLDEDGNWESIESEDVRLTLWQYARNYFGQYADDTEYSIFNSLFKTFSDTIAQYHDERLRTVYDAAFIDTATGESLDKVVADKGIVRRPAIEATGIVEFYRDDLAQQDYPIKEGTVVQTESDDPSIFHTTEPAILEEGNSVVEVNVRATEGGTKGNVATETVTVMASTPSGIHGVRNPFPIGDDDYEDTDGESFVVGEERETDDELRERAKESIGGGGVATHDNIVSSLLEVPQITSVTLLANPDPTEDEYGLPPSSVEAVVSGGTDEDVAQAIFDSKCKTSNFVGGIRGERREVSIRSSQNDQTENIAFSRPPSVNITMSLELITRDTYSGDEEIRDRIAQYVGGTLSSGQSTTGTGVGENVVIDEIRNRVVGEDTGVRGIASISTSPSIDRDDMGLDVVPIGPEQDAHVDGTDEGGIEIETVQYDV